MDSLYRQLRLSPPKLTIKGKPREIKLDLVSCMCDNKYRFTIKQNESGDYKIHTHGYAWRNFGIKHRKDDVEWIADDGSWNEVIDMLNTGTSAIQSVKYR